MLLLRGAARFLATGCGEVLPILPWWKDPELDEDVRPVPLLDFPLLAVFYEQGLCH
jgi:hypothetical protein